MAERLAQTRGFNGFSYADIATELGVTTAALHYHYAGKAELGQALIDRYAIRFAGALVDIDATAQPAPAKLAAYVEIYRGVLTEGRMCLCGMLAAEHETLPPAMRQAVVGFFAQNETWLAAVLEAGRARRSLRFDGPPTDAAQTLVGGLEGALLLARLRQDTQLFDTAAARLLRGFQRSARAHTV